MLQHGVRVAAPRPLPAPLWWSHVQTWTLPHSTHLAPPATWGLWGCRRPRGAAPLQAPIAEMAAGGGSCFGWGLGEAGAGCPGEEHPLQRNHRWEGARVTHPWGHSPPCTPRAGSVSPAVSHDGVGWSRSRGEMSHSFSTHCRASRSSSIGGCAGSVLPDRGHSRWEVSQPQKQLQLSLLGVGGGGGVPQKIGEPAPTWGSDFWGHVLGIKLQLLREAGWGLTTVDGGAQPSPAPHFSQVLGSSSGAPPRTLGCNARVAAAGSPSGHHAHPVTCGCWCSGCWSTAGSGLPKSPASPRQRASRRRAA